MKSPSVSHQKCSRQAEKWTSVSPRPPENLSPSVSTPNGADGAVDSEANDGTREAQRVKSVHHFLLDFLEANPIKNGDEFLRKLMVLPSAG